MSEQISELLIKKWPESENLAFELSDFYDIIISEEGTVYELFLFEDGSYFFLIEGEAVAYLKESKQLTIAAYFEILMLESSFSWFLIQAKLNTYGEPIKNQDGSTTYVFKDKSSLNFSFPMKADANA